MRQLHSMDVCEGRDQIAHAALGFFQTAHRNQVGVAGGEAAVQHHDHLQGV